VRRIHLQFWLLGIIAATSLSGCTIGRMLVYNFSDIHDYKRFASRPLPASPSPFLFHESPGEDILEKIEVMVPHGERKVPLDSLLPHSKTVAFLVIRNDSILCERYFQGYEKHSWVASFSMAKSYTSALVGAALAEGKIQSVDDLAVNYLPELNETNLKDLKIKHLLEMTAGIRHAENYFNPFAGVARLYYGKHLPKQIRGLKHRSPAGSEFRYQSVATQMLGEIVVRATGKDLTSYLNEKIWSHLGTEYPASWSLDQAKNGREKAFSSINATARDFAKFGRLYLNKGKWSGNQLLPERWVDESVKINETEGSAWYYGYQWWIMNRQGDYAAQGHLGQFIYVNPKHNTLIVRLGKGYGKVKWHAVFANLIQQINP